MLEDDVLRLMRRNWLNFLYNKDSVKEENHVSSNIQCCWLILFIKNLQNLIDRKK